MKKLLSMFCGSIGKKLIMAVTGILLTGFLLTHLAGNLLLLVGRDAFDQYANSLRHNRLLPAAEAVLAALFLAHILTGLKLTLENRRARPRGYAVSGSAGGKTFASTAMPYTGLLLLVFLAIHLYTFRIGGAGVESLYDYVVEAFQNKLYAGFYVLAMGGMALHVAHGFQSAFQTLGLRHEKYTPILEKTSLALAASMAGFVAIVVTLVNWGCA